jgi:hypothetical protein
MKNWLWKRPWTSCKTDYAMMMMMMMMVMMMMMMMMMKRYADASGNMSI